MTGYNLVKFITPPPPPPQKKNEILGTPVISDGDRWCRWRAVSAAGVRQVAVVTWSVRDQSSTTVLHYVMSSVLITSLIPTRVVALARTVCLSVRLFLCRGYMILVQCRPITSRHFMCEKKSFMYSFVFIAQDLATPLLGYIHMTMSLAV